MFIIAVYIGKWAFSCNKISLQIQRCILQTHWSHRTHIDSNKQIKQAQLYMYIIKPVVPDIESELL